MGNKNTLIRCYNCGMVLSDAERTTEHIPAKTLFDGYDNSYKANRITVPACFKCNNHYSLVDEEFRNMIGTIAKRNDNDVIIKKAVKTVLRKDALRNRLCLDMNGIVLGVGFTLSLIEDFHKKNFKGLFFHQYGFPLPDEYDLVVNIDENDFNQFTLGVLGYLKEFFEWKCSGHVDIFSYCMQPFRRNITKIVKNDLELNEHEKIIVGAMIYNKEHAALVYAVRKDYIQEIGHRIESNSENTND